MSDGDIVQLSPDDVQRIENVLEDTSTPAQTRKALLKRASLGLAGAGILGSIAAGCGGGGGGSSAGSTAAGTGAAAGTGTTGGAGTSTSAGAASSGDSITSIINTAITAEALAVTYLTGVIKAGKGTAVEPFLSVLRAANTEEYDHYKALKSLGAKPLTTKFWAPDAFFGTNLSGVFPTLEIAETLFVNAYLIGMTVFVQNGKADLARYAGEIGGVEAEHLALVRYAQKKLPNDLGFTDYSITSIGGIVAALEKVGVGFGKQGAKPGKFYTFAPPPSDTLTTIQNEKPQ